jgi:hypothetical protein
MLLRCCCCSSNCVHLHAHHLCQVGRGAPTCAQSSDHFSGSDGQIGRWCMIAGGRRHRWWCRKGLWVILGRCGGGRIWFRCLRGLKMRQMSQKFSRKTYGPNFAQVHCTGPWFVCLDPTQPRRIHWLIICNVNWPMTCKRECCVWCQKLQWVKAHKCFDPQPVWKRLPIVIASRLCCNDNLRRGFGTTPTTRT